MQRQQAFEDCLDPGDKPQRISRKWLCMDDIVKHFHKHGAFRTFAASVCEKVLVDGQTACLCYAFPKWKLDDGQNKHGELCAMLKLGLAQTLQDNHRACSNVHTGVWDWMELWIEASSSKPHTAGSSIKSRFYCFVPCLLEI